VPLIRISQLNAAQLKDREVALSILKPANFSPTDDERLLEQGLAMATLVSLGRSNGSFEVIIELKIDNPTPLVLRLSKLEGLDSPYVRMLIDHEGRLKELLQLIVGFQDRINEQNYKEILSELLGRFPTIYADLGEDGLRQLVADDDIPF